MWPVLKAIQFFIVWTKIWHCQTRCLHQYYEGVYSLKHDSHKQFNNQTTNIYILGIRGSRKILQNLDFSSFQLTTCGSGGGPKLFKQYRNDVAMFHSKKMNLSICGLKFLGKQILPISPFVSKCTIFSKCCICIHILSRVTLQL